ncbi:hypothetical protein SEA_VIACONLECTUS_63 [Gordonia phage ViaConlectus]|uniref:Uncharacterized protein n=1 Tax=Gordonia phage ViaConlectus TaxID=2972515 RepID=A0A976UE55_9CAUD|nr:hypothetical protein SEA_VIACONLECTUS_63 [Gordonia phage ViaConlectus]
MKCDHGSPTVRCPGSGHPVASTAAPAPYVRRRGYCPACGRQHAVTTHGHMYVHTTRQEHLPMTTPSNPYSQPAPIPGQYGTPAAYPPPPADPPAAPTADGGVGTIHDDVLHLDYSAPEGRAYALDLAVRWTERDTAPTDPVRIVEVAEMWRKYIEAGDIPK